MSSRRLTQAKIAVIGSSGVGKSAFVVRYITKRFIGDYQSNTENSYTCRVNTNSQRDEEITLTIIDTSFQGNEDAFREHILSSDGLILIYSVDDRQSLHEAHAIRATYLTHRHPNSPLVIVANKNDLVHCRCVSEREGDELASVLDSPIYEISVADSSEGVVCCIDELVRQIMREHVKSSPFQTTKTNQNEPGRRSKLLNMKKAFKRHINRSRSDTF